MIGSGTPGFSAERCQPPARGEERGGGERRGKMERREEEGRDEEFN